MAKPTITRDGSDSAMIWIEETNGTTITKKQMKELQYRLQLDQESETLDANIVTQTARKTEITEILADLDGLA